MSLSKEELGSLVRGAVADALKVQQPVDLQCPDCQAKFGKVPEYLDHRVNEYVGKSLEELKGTIDALKVPTSEEFLADCKDGLCALVEETYNVTKKGEEAAGAGEEEAVGLFDHHEDEEEA